MRLTWESVRESKCWWLETELKATLKRKSITETPCQPPVQLEPSAITFIRLFYIRSTVEWGAPYSTVPLLPKTVWLLVHFPFRRQALGLTASCGFQTFKVRRNKPGPLLREEVFHFPRLSSLRAEDLSFVSSMLSTK